MARFSVKMAQAQESGERRSGPRHQLVFRVAKLMAGGRELLCVVRNVSVTGVSVRTYGRPVLPARMQIELANGTAMDVERVWRRDEIAAFRFHHSTSVDDVLTPEQAFPSKRGIRLRLDEPLMVKDQRGTHTMRLLDISVGGVRLAVSESQVIGDEVEVMLPDLPSRKGDVRWRRPGFVGVSFREPLRFGDLAEWSARRFAAGPSE